MKDTRKLTAEEEEELRILSQGPVIPIVPSVITKTTEELADSVFGDSSPARVMFTLPDDIAMESDLSLFDREVHDAVLSLYAANNRCFTLPMLWRALTKSTRYDLTETQIDILEKSVRKCRLGEVTLTLTGSEHGEHDGEEKVVSGNLLFLIRDETTIKGFPCVAYWFVNKPLLLACAERYGYLHTISADMLSMPVNSSVRNISTRGFLLQKIINAKEKGEDVVAFPVSLIFSLRGTKARSEKKRAKDAVSAILQRWVSKAYISNFDFCESDESKSENLRIFL